MTKNTILFIPKIPTNFECKNCDYITSSKKDYNKHLLTLKHKKLSKDEDFSLILEKKVYKCNCGKIYKHSSSLWNHKKNCNISNLNEEQITTILKEEDISDKQLIVELVKQNSQLMEMLKNNSNAINNINNSVNNNCNNYSNNKSFNLNFFLNETCKNAMNIMDFADSIKLKLNDLENIGELGYIEGISKIIIDNLNLLDVTERPVHCSDFKRDVLYVKHNNTWEKENEDNTKIKKLITSVTNKNISLIPEWKQKYPECTKSNSTKSTKINKMIMEVMDTDKVKQNKIIKKIAKEVIINKE